MTTTKVPVPFVVVLGLSRSVTSWPLKVGLVLQIEILDSGVFVRLDL